MHSFHLVCDLFLSKIYTWVAIWGQKTGHEIDLSGGREETIVNEACQNLEMLKWFHSVKKIIPWTDSSLKIAVETGNLEMVQWMCNPLKQNHCPCPLSFDAIRAAVCYGHLEILNWMCARFPWDLAFRYAISFETIKSNQLGALKMLRDQDLCPWDTWLCHHAAGYGRLEILKWLRSVKEPCPWGYMVLRDALEYDQWEVLPWDDRICFELAKREETQMLNWLGENGCRCDYHSHGRAVTQEET